ncbi:FGGY-family carbohydrate kinase [Cereibacter sphaeroides]|uniref:FGGY-family carbohydrate kinase n=1 Tax=Cereibacter sphaeroides TaxID=1063 RepID=UPI000AF9356E|nr:FGGY-family carbohydrate kinase [Cereibacter sphaeroides]
MRPSSRGATRERLRLTPPAERLVFAGGAAKSAHWSQILADVTGLTVVTPEVKEANAQGCASAAAPVRAISPRSPRRAVPGMRIDRTSRRIPRSARSTTSRRPLGPRLCAQRGLVQDGTATAMWRAPGT